MTTNNETKIAAAIKDHGLFSGSRDAVERYRKLSRSALVLKMCEIYGPNCFGGKPSHWRTYTKYQMAIILADCRCE